MNADPATPRKLRWFQFALRDVLWLIIACGIAVAWWHDRWRLADAADASARELEERRAEADRLREDLIAASNASKTHGFQDLITCPFPPAVWGRIVSTESERGIVEISVGSDHGLTRGQELEVCRLGTTLDTTRYLGKIRLISVDKMKAMGSIVRTVRQLTIEVDDHVATRLE